MHILIFNWKDIRHPAAGGAEIVTHQFAKHLVSFGHQVTIVSSHYKNLAAEETIDRVSIFRRGNIYTVHLHAFLLYRQRYAGWADIVIDQIHGIPFFTPFYVKKPVLAYIHEVADTIWFSEYPFPLSSIGYFLESLYFKLYRNTTFLTDSVSTKHDLQGKDILSSNVHVLPLTIKRVPKMNLSKTKYPSLIYIGRITPMKRIEFLIMATRLLIIDFPKLKVTIVGNGKTTYIKRLKMLVGELKLAKYISFKEYVNEKKKFELFKTHALFIHPSLKEGFGLTVLEAASQGTPTVAFAVGGLRDLIKNRQNGILVDKDASPENLAQVINNLLRNPKQIEKYSMHAYSWSKKLPTWEQQTKRLEQLLMRLVHQ